ncbi:hypothetical protein [Cetobacterium sp.]|uniref:hypothetical protein n=1 Tax=Cetobacterium sp. TaxID=2071632 RepID=UPI003F3C6670
MGLLKKIIAYFLIIVACTYASEIEGHIYKFVPRGGYYSGVLEGKISTLSDNAGIKIIPSTNIDITSVNGTKNENNLYSLEDKKIRVEFIYRSKSIPENGIIEIGTIESSELIRKSETLTGKLNVEFREKGKLDLKISGKMDFGIINPRVPSSGISSRENPVINVSLKTDKRDVGNSKLHISYPKTVSFGDGKAYVIIENGTSKNLKAGEKDREIMTSIPDKSDYSEKIELRGRLYSRVKELPPGEYKATAKVKAYYEYLDFSDEKKSDSNKIVIRR